MQSETPLRAIKDHLRLKVFSVPLLSTVLVVAAEVFNFAIGSPLGWETVRWFVLAQCLVLATIVGQELASIQLNMSESKNQIISRLNSQDVEISQIGGSLSKALDHRILSLDQTASEIIADLATLLPGSEVEIDVIGQMLSFTRSKIYELVHCVHGPSLAINMHCLDPSFKDWGVICPQEVASWSAQVPTSIAYFVSHFDGIQDTAKKQKRKILISVRGYAFLPYVHGFKVKIKSNDGQKVSYYICVSRFDILKNGDKETTAGFDFADHFHPIPPNIWTPGNKDLISVFEGMLCFCRERSAQQLYPVIKSPESLSGSVSNPIP